MDRREQEVLMRMAIQEATKAAEEEIIPLARSWWIRMAWS